MQEKGDVHNLKEQLKTIYQQAQKMYESPAVGHPDLEPVQPSPTPMDSSGIPPDSEEPREPEHDDEEYLEEKADDSFDPEKTQETTPAKSQAQTVPFRFDISGINLPVFNLQTPTVPLPSSLSPEPSQVVVIKDEPQSPIKLLRPSTTSKPNPVATTIKATGAPNSVTSKALKHSNQPQTIQLPLVPPSTLGKRKAPTEDDRTPRTDVRRPARVELQLQLMDGTILPESSLESTAKKRRGLDEDDDMDSPSVRPAAGKGKGTAKEVTGSRGRISEGPSGNTTLNSRYEINPARNGGLNYAYDEVVRKKQERRKLDAGTCADCIEYYKTVGPMPPRAQAPLWRSPTSSQEEGTTARAGCTCAKGKSRQRDGDEEDDDEADTSAHQKEISRHRHQFPAGKSPPGYWELGFPDTQRVSEIREAAERMYEEKERTMEKEARKSDGKYRRR
ncbi:hypothetical protein M408DRAFT_333275 [Serendipita vermifera MAFF 305830]|uniref:DNA endonuclease activator Ctp1 C-terminal domain-containing protein n=1 Tax=Serendipita vermifera MAFF 305830 TaxID=933852 RepID=A0A0C3AR44_SERVB|nr:hypothetical protein M408DRAFT_333275 [Serendipita vermifera MAFF 305830]